MKAYRLQYYITSTLNRISLQYFCLSREYHTEFLKRHVLGCHETPLSLCRPPVIDTPLAPVPSETLFLHDVRIKTITKSSSQSLCSSCILFEAVVCWTFKFLWQFQMYGGKSQNLIKAGGHI